MMVGVYMEVLKENLKRTSMPWKKGDLSSNDLEP